MKFDAVYTAKRAVGKDEVLRQALIQLVMKENTPVDVVDVEFGEVKETFLEIIEATAYFEGTCTATVGYLRWRSARGSHDDRDYRWEPFSTEYKGTVTYLTFDSDKAYYLSSLDAKRLLGQIPQEDFVEEGESPVTSERCEHVLKMCRWEAEREAVNVGDEVKDRNSNFHTERMESMICYRLPKYEVTYSYKGEEHSQTFYACRGLYEFEIREYPTTDERFVKWAKLKKATEKSVKMVWTAALAASVASIVFCFALKIFWFWIVAVAAIAAAIINGKQNEKKCNHYVYTFSGELIREKVDALKKSLQERGYQELADSEVTLEKISPNNPEHYNHIEKQKIKIPGKGIFCIVLCVIAIITSYITYQFELHSTKYVDVQVVGKYTEYYPESHKYAYKYAVRFDVNVETEKVGVERVAVKIIINENGEELGYIDANLKDLELEKGESTMTSFYLDGSTIEGNSLFAVLYNADFADLEFEYEIEYVSFADNFT